MTYRRMKIVQHSVTEIFWPHMANGVHYSLLVRQKCVWQAFWSHQKQKVQFFQPLSGETIATDIPRPLAMKCPRASGSTYEQ